MIKEYQFANPEYFFLLALIPLYFLWSYFKRKTWHPAVKNAGGFLKNSPDYTAIVLKALSYLPLVAYCFLVISLARPQKTFSEEKIKTEGIDIIMAMDVSTSMLARDLKPDRMRAAKNVAVKFVESRPNDRIGMVVFAGESFTQCPITTDHKILINQITKIRDGLIQDGTAIGMGLGTAVNRLKESQAKSKIIILMTDGVNNTGYIDPVTAIDLAISEDIRVYTIGLGSKGKAPYPMKDFFGRTVLQDVDVEIDEELLKEIAKKTGGVYYRATSNSELSRIYKAIDQLEKTKIELSSYERKTEHFRRFALIALGILLLSFLLNRFLIEPLN